MVDNKKTLEEMGKEFGVEPSEFLPKQLQDVVSAALKMNTLSEPSPSAGSDLLGLVDQFFADVLLKNVFTDTNRFTGAVQEAPDNAYNHIPNVDPRNLNFNPANPHPHEGKAGVGPKHIIPQSDTKPLHDTQGSYLGPGTFDSRDGAITPSKLAEIYQKNIPAGTPHKSIQEQAADIKTRPVPEVQKNPKEIPVGHTPQDRADRDKIYEQSNHRNNAGNPINSLLEFHKSVEDDRRLAKEQFNSNAEIRDDIYNIPDEQAQVKSNIGGTVDSKPTVGDTLATQGGPPPRPSEAADQRSLVPTEGGLRRKDPGHRLGNAYDDGANSLFNRGGNYSAIPGEVSALRFFDIFAIAHWFRAVAKEGIPLPVVSREDTSGGIGRDKFEISTEAIAKGVQWNVSQLLLAAMNPTDTQGYGLLNALWNPLSLTLSAIPLVRSTPAANITVGAALAGVGFGGYKQNAENSVSATIGGFAPPLVGERLLLMRQGQYVQSLDGNQIAQLRFPNSGYKGNIIGSSQGTIEGEGLLAALFSAVEGLFASSISQQVDEPASAVDKPGVDRNLYSVNARYGDAAYLPQKELEENLETVSGFASSPDPTGEALKVSSLFKPYAHPGGSLSPFNLGSIAGAVGLGDVSSHYFKAAPDADVDLVSFANTVDAPGLVAAVTDVAFSPLDETEGVLDATIEEENIYMPFMFQDLRDVEDRFLYFRAFLKPGMAETFTPDWQVERYYGRVDQVPIYMGTLRTLALSFDVVAWSPKDLPVMWKKLQKLQSMVYPFYNKGGFLKSGPIIRMRIGDLFANQLNKGLPGYITSMDWSYDDGIWNMKTDFKVPRKVTVSLGFTVLHDGNPGTYPFKGSEATPQNIDFAADLNEQPKTTDGFTFGAGKIENKDGNVTIKVDTSEIRKIFEGVRNKSGEPS